jgi:hypothetical protein
LERISQVASTGIAVASQVNAYADLDTSIIAHNHASKSPDLAGTFVITSPNLIQDPSGNVTFLEEISPTQQTLKLGYPQDPYHDEHSFIISRLSPDLDPLNESIGPTPIYALKKNSPAVGQLNNTMCIDIGISTDQRGKPRPQKPGGNCDIGAYEFS